MKILKNNTLSPVTINDMGIVIPASSSYTVPDQDFLLLSNSSNAVSLVNDGSLLVNDGYNDISPIAAAVAFIRYPETALGTRFLSNPQRNNGFISKNVQDAIEESKNTLTVYSATATADVIRTANTFGAITDMNLTPPAGTYLAIWSSEVMMSNLNGRGEVAIFVGGTQQTALTHAIEVEIALLLGLIGTAIIEEGASNISGLITCNGSQTVQVGIRSIDGEDIIVGRRSFVLVRTS